MAKQIIRMCNSSNLSVVYCIYDEIESIAKIKKSILDRQGIIARIIKKESMDEKVETCDLILFGRNEFDVNKTKTKAVAMQYLPALLEYYLIVYKIIQPTFDIQPFMSVTTDKYINLKSVEDIRKKSGDGIDEYVCTCLASDLGVSKSDIDVHISFTEYGMNSILMARLYSKLAEEYGDMLEPADVIEAKSAKQIIELLKEKKTKEEKNSEERKQIVEEDSNNKQEIFTTSSGNEYEITIEGEGTPLVFLTALAFLPNIWKYQKNYWKHKYKMIFICGLFIGGIG